MSRQVLSRYRTAVAQICGKFTLHAAAYNLFNVQRHLISRNTLRQVRNESFAQWRQVTASERNLCAEPGDLKRCSLCSRRLSGWCEFSARLFLRSPCTCSQFRPSPVRWLIIEPTFLPTFV